MLRCGLAFLLFTLCFSKCIASECKNGTLVLSLFGLKNATGKWDLYYDFDRNFCDTTESWRLDFIQDWNSGRKLRLKGFYRERIPESELNYATPIQFGENEKMETVFITRKKGTVVDTGGIPVPEALLEPLPISKPADEIESEGTAISEALTQRTSESQKGLLKNLDSDSKEYPAKTAEDGIRTNEIEGSSKSHAKAIEAHLEEQPAKSFDAEAAAVPEGNTTGIKEKSSATRKGIRENVKRDGIQETGYNTTTATEDVKICSGHKSGDETKMKIITREEWKAQDSRKDFEALQSPVKFVYVTHTNHVCHEAQGCSQILLKMQKVLMDCFGDVYSNFFLDDGGRVYEGLGWSRARSNDSLYVHFLTDLWELPPSETFASFALLLWEGVRVGRVSEEFEVVPNNKVTKSFRKELQRWAEWSKRMGGRTSLT